MKSWLRGSALASALIGLACSTHALDPNAGTGGAGGGAESGGSGGLDGGPSRIDAPGIEAFPPHVCGNGFLDPGEQCDDGNQVAGDGCTPLCQLDCYLSTCAVCGTAGPCQVPPAVCGDGRLSGAEICDDHNAQSGDGCSSDCTAVETGWVCPVPGRRCFPICGDGRVVGSETCDDGNTMSGDGCSSICLVEPTDERCGDGVIEGAEQCDVGGSGFDSGVITNCTADCRLRYCGDGVLDPGEQCDNGAHDNNVTYGNMSGCAPGCLFPHFCGDAIVDSDEGEQCDLGVNNGQYTTNAFCSTDCKILVDL
jgi:cysteine-rich repeat protein